MTSQWKPGMPVVTAQDRIEWQQWRKERKREGQRARRAQYPRIDYYPDDAAAAVIYGMTKPQAGHDLSSVINRIVSEWAATGDEVSPE
jgi:hypothetical protein